MDNIPLYNSRIIKAYVEYLKEYHPDVDLNSILNKSGIPHYEIDDEGHWFTQRQVDSFHDALIAETNDPSIAREAGRYIASPKASGILRQYVTGFLTLKVVYWMMEKIGATMTRHATIKTKMIGTNKVEVTFKPRVDVNEKPYQCENRIGLLEAPAKAFTNKYAHIEHPNCIHRGDDCCRYIITWEKSPAFTWKRTGNYFSILGLLSCSVLFFTLPILSWAIVTLLCALTSAGIFFWSERLEKKELSRHIESQGNAADQLINQINIRYNESLLIQEIGQATSSILDIKKLLEVVMETLRKRLDFDRGMIMLANKERTRLVFTAGYGYKPELEAFLRHTEFDLDNPPHSKGPLLVAFSEQKSSLINDIKEHEKNTHPKRLEYLKKLGVQSFICVPIVYEGRSEGILAVDILRHKREFNQGDMSLLMGIAPQIAISINNARTYHKIRESEERFRNLSENAPDIIYTLGIDGAFTYVNPTWESILGHTKEEVIGKYFIDFAPKGDTKTYVDFFKRVRDDKETIKGFNGTLLKKDGSERLFNISGAPNFDSEGNYIGLVGTFKDITEQRNLEAQLRHASKMETVGTLTGGIAHDFNNIIQAISGYSQLLIMKKKEADPDWKYLSNINQLIQRASGLTEQLLFFSRKVESKLKPLDLNDEIKNLADLLKSAIPQIITIELDMADKLNIISGDSVQLGQVIMNLVVNAKDVMPDGGKITIKTENVAIDESHFQDNLELKAGSYVLVSVSDTGHGMNKEISEHIFEPFFTTKEAGQGTGLGLSVAYGIVKNHGGHIICESKPGKGTIFKIYFPVPEKIDQEGIREIEAKEELPVGSETILLVDDEKHLLEVGQDTLNYYGYTTLTAESGEEAIEIFKKEEGLIDLVMLDLIMPGMGGHKCLLELLRIDPTAKVIITSGYTASIKAKDLLRDGATGFINKPYRLSSLLKEIRKVLSEGA